MCVCVCASSLQQLVFPTVFVKYDFGTAAPIRNEKGFCVRAKRGKAQKIAKFDVLDLCCKVKLRSSFFADDTGLLLIEVKKDFEFDGYQGSESQTSAKIVRDVFKKGDAYFNSGDLFTMDKEYFVYFADRIGDTFRYTWPRIFSTVAAKREDWKKEHQVQAKGFSPWRSTLSNRGTAGVMKWPDSKSGSTGWGPIPKVGQVWLQVLLALHLTVSQFSPEMAEHSRLRVHKVRNRDLR